MVDPDIGMIVAFDPRSRGPHPSWQATRTRARAATVALPGNRQQSDASVAFVAAAVRVLSALSRRCAWCIKHWISTTRDNPDMAERPYGDAMAVSLPGPVIRRDCLC